MTQHLWYVRRRGVTSGPFPARQLRETFSLGQLDLRDEVSLDGHAWLKLLETDILDVEHTPVHAAEPEDDDWRREREKAKLRWISNSDEPGVGDERVISSDETSDRLRRHEAETRTMLDAQSHKRPAFVAGLAMVLILLLIGVGVWMGQSGDTKIQASVASRVRNCNQPPTEGVNWSGCNKIGAVLSHVDMRNADLSGGHFGRADFAGADLSYANLGFADLRGANLKNAVLKGAALNQTDLTGADLSGADLSFAVMNGAVVNGVRLDGASLAQSTWIDGRVCGEQSVGTCQ
jgi:hypothetical protein